MPRDTWDTHVRYCSDCTSEGPGCNAGRRYYGLRSAIGTTEPSGPRAPHQDKRFNHAPHLVATLLTLGGWLGIWFWRLTLHKIDRNREAIFELAQMVDVLDS